MSLSADAGTVGRLEPILAFQRRSAELVAERVRKIPEGWVMDTPSLPLVWSLNHVRIAKPVSYEHALELCSMHHPKRDHVHVHIEPDAAGELLASRFRADGWEVEVNLHLALARESSPAVETSAIIEPGEDEAEALMERWWAEDETLELTAGVSRQLLEYNTSTWRARNARRLGIRLGDGQLAGITLLFSDGVVGQVEDVYVIPEARGRGYGRALVTAAVELALAARHELIFIVADDNDWPKHLYMSVGFEPVGRSWLFHRKTPA